MIPSKVVNILAYVLVMALLGATIYGTYVYEPKDNSVTTSELEPSTVEYVEKIFDDREVGSISVEIDKKVWQELLDNPLEDTFVSCNVTIAGETFYNVGIKPKGNSSLTSVASTDSEKFSFKLDFNEFVTDQTCFGLEAIALNNNMSDSTLMKEYLSYELYELLGLETPENAYTQLYINGNLHGLYLAVEDIDTTFIERNYGTTEGNLYKPEGLSMMNGNNGNRPNLFNNNKEMPEGFDPDNKEMPEGFDPDNKEMPEGFNPDNMEMPVGDVQRNRMPGGGMGGSTGGEDLKYIDDNLTSYSTLWDGAVKKSTSEEDYEAIFEMIKSLDSGENIEEHLDVENILKYFAVNTYLVNLDSYSGGMYHNYYLYENYGVVKIIPWDLNMSFGGFSMNMNGTEGIINFPIDKPVNGELEDFPLIGKLLENPEYKELYHSYLQQIYDEYNANGLFNTLVDQVDQIINESVKNDPNSFVTYDEYTAGVSEIKLFMKERSMSILAQLQGEQPSEAIGDITTTVDMSKLGDMSSMGGGMRGKPNR